MEEKVLGRAIGELVGATRRSNNVSGRRRTSKTPKRRVSFDRNARDADADNLVQEGTNQERRASGAASRRVAAAGGATVKPKPRKLNAEPLSRERRPIPERKRPKNQAAARQVRKPVAKPEEVKPEALKPRIQGRRDPADRKPKVGNLPPVKRREGNADNVAVVNRPADGEAKPKPQMIGRRDRADRKPKVRQLRPPKRRKGSRPNELRIPKPGQARPVLRPEAQREGGLIPGLDERIEDIVGRGRPAVGKGAVGNLRESQLQPEEQRLVREFHVSRGPLINEHMGSFEDLDYINQQVDRYIAQKDEFTRAAADVAAKIRRERRGNPEETRMDQVRYLILKDRAATMNNVLVALQAQRTRLQRRQNVIDQVKRAEAGGGDAFEREQALKDAVQAIDVLDRNDAGDQLIGREMRRRLDAIRPEIEAAVVKQNGPVDYNDVVAALNPRDARVNRQIDEAIERYVDDPAELDEMREELQAHIADLGPEVRPQAGPSGDVDREKNVSRRWAKAKIRQIDQKTNKRDLLSVFANYPAPRERPDHVGQIADDGGPRYIESRNIKTADDAVEFVRQGGSMSDVPNKYWAVAMIKNSSDAETDKNSKFRMVSPTGGAIGLTKLMFARDESGKMTQTGWVIKADNDGTTAAEVISQQLMIEHGLPVMGAGWDGTVGESGIGAFANRNKGANEVFAVLPLAFNGMGEGYLTKGASSYSTSIFEDLPDKAVDVRLAHFLHNFMLGVDDRHSGNGVTRMVDGVPYAIPIDQGWAGHSGTSDLFDYQSQFSMDGVISGKIFNVIKNAKTEELREDIKRRTAAVYDEYIERAQKIVDEGVDAMIKKTIGDPRNMTPEINRRVLGLFRNYKANLVNLKANRDRFFSKAGIS